MIEFIQAIGSPLTFWVVIPLMLIVGTFLTVRLRGIQLRCIVEGFRHLLDRKDASCGSISNFEAVSAVLAGNLGTGNISGMAVALSVGGPGSLLWMWLMVLLGMVIKYAECLLGVKYRHINEEGEYVGGPMYYLEKVGPRKILSILFCLFTLGGALTAGNLVQVNSLVLPLKVDFLTDIAIGLVVAGAVASIIFGGLQRIAHVVAAVVPLMTLIYLMGALAILVIFYRELPQAFEMIITDAWKPWSLGGAAAGWGVIKVMTTGFERGIFATDAGIGMSAILQSGAQTRNAPSEGLVGMVPPIIVLFVCSITTLVLLVTGAWQVPGLQSTTMCTWAFEHGLGHPAASWLVMVSIILFGMTTILAWAFCGEKAIEYLFGLKAVRWFNIFFVMMIPLGAVAEVHVVWALADLSIALMLITNLIGVIYHFKRVILESLQHQLV
jgi:alanine or glycine:cation symporter, AGCS family